MKKSRPSPLLAALLCLLPYCAEAAVGLPALTVDPALFRPGSPSVPVPAPPIAMPKPVKVEPPAAVQPEAPKPPVEATPVAAPTAPAAAEPAAPVAPPAPVAVPKAEEKVVLPAPAAPRAEPAPEPATPAPAPIVEKPAAPIPPPEAVTPPAPVAAPLAPPAAIVPPAVEPAAEKATAPAPAPEPAVAPKAEAPAPSTGEDIGSPVLRVSRGLSFSPPPTPEDALPIIVQAIRIEGRKDQEIEAFGDAELRKWGQSITADHLRYNRPEDELFAEGNVRVEQELDTTSGTMLKLKLEQKTGEMASPTFQMNSHKPNGRGEASKLLFEGDNRFRLTDASYTTCPVGNDDWFIRAGELELDRPANTGTAYNGHIEFQGVPILYSPYISFPLTRVRKSGFLTPSFGSTGQNGAEFALPYYWNIAPNRDATITPRYMQKRGMEIMTEFRYLESDYTGQVNVEALNDKLADRGRHFLSLNHLHSLGAGWTGNLNLQKVSDDNYFRDLANQLGATTQTNLSREGSLAYRNEDWSFMARAQRFQTLQDPLTPVVAPYHRAPQLTLSGGQRDIYGADLALASEFVSFTHTSQASGRRLMLNPSVSLPLTQPYAYLTPKLGLHFTRYDLDQTTTTLPDKTRTLPIFSLDGGLFFEKDADLFGNSFVQTLEPRAYYLYVPYRDQGTLPMFDSGENGFGMAQIFSENRFSGIDRFSDANQVTLGLTSRLLETNGTERLRATVAQRYFLKLPQTNIGAAPTKRFSDILASVGGQVNRELGVDSAWQYDPDTRRTRNLSLAARYRPGVGKILNASYRYSPATTSALRQIDTSVQWPLSAGWSGLGRWNYSIADRKVLEGLAGVEYNAGCWALRTVAHTFTTGAEKRSNGIFFQLELNGVSQIGSNPFDVLKRNIYGYAKTTDETSDEIKNFDLR